VKSVKRGQETGEIGKKVRGKTKTDESIKYQVQGEENNKPRRNTMPCVASQLSPTTHNRIRSSSHSLKHTHMLNLSLLPLSLSRILSLSLSLSLSVSLPLTHSFSFSPYCLCLLTFCLLLSSSSMRKRECFVAISLCSLWLLESCRKRGENEKEEREKKEEKKEEVELLKYGRGENLRKHK
jgi:hypothetical protein